MIGTVLADGAAIVQERWRTMLGIAVVGAVVLGIVGAALVFSMLAISGDGGQPAAGVPAPGEAGVPGGTGEGTALDPATAPVAAGPRGGLQRQLVANRTPAAEFSADAAATPADPLAAGDTSGEPPAPAANAGGEAPAKDAPAAGDTPAEGASDTAPSGGTAPTGTGATGTAEPGAAGTDPGQPTDTAAGGETAVDPAATTGAPEDTAGTPVGDETQDPSAGGDPDATEAAPVDPAATPGADTGAVGQPGSTSPTDPAADATTAPTDAQQSSSDRVGPVARYVALGLKGLVLAWVLLGAIYVYFASVLVRNAAYDESLGDHFREALRAMPWVLPQVGVSYAPLLAVGGLALLFAQLSKFLAIGVFVLAVVPVSVACTVIGGIALVRAALGEQSRLPRNALEVARTHTGTIGGVAAVLLFLGWLTALPAVIPLLPLQLLALPVNLVVHVWAISCFVAMHQSLPEPLSFGTTLREEVQARMAELDGEQSAGNGSTSTTATDTAAGAGGGEEQVYRLPAAAQSNIDPDVLAAIEAEEAASRGGATTAVADATAPAAAASTTSAATTAVAAGTTVTTTSAASAPAAPVAGPTFDGVVQPGATWGEWLQVGAAGPVMVQLAWSEGAAVALQVATQDGTWLQVPPLDATAQATTFEVAAAGYVWLQCASQAQVAQSVRIATWLVPATGASAGVTAA